MGLKVVASGFSHDIASQEWIILMDTIFRLSKTTLNQLTKLTELEHITIWECGAMFF